MVGQSNGDITSGLIRLLATVIDNLPLLTTEKNDCHLWKLHNIHKTCIEHKKETVIGKSTCGVLCGLGRHLTPQFTLHLSTGVKNHKYLRNGCK